MAERIRGHEWFDVRERIVTRDGNECQNCGEGSNLVVHHIVPIAVGGTNRHSNLLTLCRCCHRNAHGHRSSQLETTSSDTPPRKIFTVDEIATVCGSIRHPLTLGLTVTFAKTGIGIGELCKLSIDDVAIPGISRSELPELNGPGLRIKYGGEIPYNNRRERHQQTVIPIDTELEHVLRRWFAIRPDCRSNDPVFVDTGDAWGTRIDPASVRYRLQSVGERIGYYRSGCERENLTPLAFRYFFKERFTVDPHYRDYILGKRSFESIDISAVEQDYRESIFSLFQ